MIRSFPGQQIVFSLLLLVTFVVGCEKKEDPASAPGVTISTSAATGVASTTATVVVTYTHSGDVSAFSKWGICYGQSPNPTAGSNSPSFPELPTPEIPWTLIDLTPGKVYFARGFATDKSGKITYGNEITFTTGPVELVVATLDVGPIAGDQAKAGLAFGLATVTKVIKAKGICWGTLPDPTTNDQKTDGGAGVCTPGPSENNTCYYSFTMTGLKTNTQYWVRGYVVDETGKITYGQSKSFTTLPVSVRINEPKDVWALKATISGEIGGDVTVIKKGYLISESPITITNINQRPDNMAWSTLGNVGGTGKFSEQKKFLLSHKTYYAKAFAVDQNNVNYFSNEVTFTTPDTMYFFTEGPQVVTSTGAAFRYNLEGGWDEMPETGFVFDTKENPTLAGNKQLIGTGFVNNRVAALTNLQPATRYFVRMYARVSTGQVAYGPQKTFTTGGGDNWMKVVTNASSAIQSTSATMNGSVTAGPNASLAGTVSNRDFVVSELPGFDPLIDMSLEQGSGFGSFSRPRTFLAPSRKYYARAVVQTYWFNGTQAIAYRFYGEEVSFTTLPDNTIGKVVFYTNQNMNCGNIEVLIGAAKAPIAKFQASAPACGADGFATFTLKQGTYDFVARCTGLTWGGKITVTANSCTPILLVPGSPPVNNPTPTAPTGITAECPWDKWPSVSLIKTKVTNDCVGDMQTLTFRNNSEFTLDLCVYQKKRSGGWQPNGMRTLSPGEITDAFWMCDVTGEVRWYANIASATNCSCPVVK